MKIKRSQKISNKTLSILLFLEALILLAPITLVALLGIVFSLSVLFDMVGNVNHRDILLLIFSSTGIYSVFVLWSLAVSTIAQQKHKYDLKYYMGIFCGVIASIFCILGSFEGALLAILPPLIVAIHFNLIQKKLK